MEPVFFLVTTITLTQLVDAYLRYLSFAAELDKRSTRNLWLRFGGWAALCFPVYVFMFQFTGITAATYKFVLMTGWMPYMAIFLRTLPGRFLPMIYVFGMSAIWCFVTHNWSSIALSYAMSDAAEANLFLVHALLYLLWFALLLPWERRYFRGLLPPRDIFGIRPLGTYLSLLPLAIIIGHILQVADGAVWHSAEERLSRLYLPLVFIFICRYLPFFAEQVNQYHDFTQRSKILEKQTVSLEAYRETLQRNRENFLRLQRDLRHNYNHLANLIRKGKIDRAKSYLRRQENKLDAVTIRPYSEYATINAALSDYVNRALALGISFQPEIRLPPAMSEKENDLAVLLCNLLENALMASAKEPVDQRGMALVLRFNGQQFIMEVANRSTCRLNLDDDGFPSAEGGDRGHGMGMVSLKFFLRKHNGYAAFVQKNGWVRLYAYWTDGL